MRSKEEHQTYREITRTANQKRSVIVLLLKEVGLDSLSDSNDSFENQVFQKSFSVPSFEESLFRAREIQKSQPEGPSVEDGVGRSDCGFEHPTRIDRENFSNFGLKQGGDLYVVLMIAAASISIVTAGF